MSSVGYAHGRRAREAAAKERRKKLLAFAGLGLFLVVLAIQVPKTLDMLRVRELQRDELFRLEHGRPRAQPSAAKVSRRSAALPAHNQGRRSLRLAPSRGRGDPSGRGRRVGGLHDPFQQPSAATPRPAAPRTADSAAHHRRHPGYAGAEGRLHRRARLDSDVEQSSLGGAVRPHGPSARRRWRRRPPVVCS